jgi:hypothetical protein
MGGRLPDLHSARWHPVPTRRQGVDARRDPLSEPIVTMSDPYLTWLSHWRFAARLSGLPSGLALAVRPAGLAGLQGQTTRGHPLTHKQVLKS